MPLSKQEQKGKELSAAIGAVGDVLDALRSGKTTKENVRRTRLNAASAIASQEASGAESNQATADKALNAAAEFANLGKSGFAQVAADKATLAIDRQNNETSIASLKLEAEAEYAVQNLYRQDAAKQYETLATIGKDCCRETLNFKLYYSPNAN